MRLLIDPRRTAIDMVIKNGVGVEVGVHIGDFSSVILDVAKPKKLFLIDPWKYFSDSVHKDSMYGGERVNQKDMDTRYERVLKRFNAQISSGKVEVFRELSVDAVHRFKNGELDFVYIDGDHSYESVIQDLRTFFPKVKTGGLIISDDYTLGGWWKDGVVRACNEFLLESRSLVEFKLAGQFAIRKLV
jgi:hypothetical protein